MTIDQHERATQETIDNLRFITKSIHARKLTKLSLPEIESVIGLVGKVVPAGNVPGMILSGLTRIAGDKVQPQKVRQDVNILLNEVSMLFERAKYGTMFAGPAAIIWGYQQLLKLAGKDFESAFPEGVWQFYVDYALREDTARHANETHGFDTLLDQNNIQLTKVDRITAWVMAAVTCLHTYHRLLECEWREHMSLWALQDISGKADLFNNWQHQKPYTRSATAAEHDYPTYRRLKFDNYLMGIVNTLTPAQHKTWDAHHTHLTTNSLTAYQTQMTLLAYLEPASFNETRIPIPIEKAQIGIIQNGTYFLLPACEPGTSNPLDVRTARAQIAHILNQSPTAASDLTQFARLKRTELPALRKKLNPTLQQSLETLRFAPILLNTDLPSDTAKHLAQIRQGERGVGDHPLTIFDTGKTFVFDQSHIFFDGAWGAALAEILTNEALSWAVYLNLLSPVVLVSTKQYTQLELQLKPDDAKALQEAEAIPPEASAENNTIDVQACLTLKHYFKQRNDLLKLTVNDLLVLYRALHAVTYQPSQTLKEELLAFTRSNPQLGKQVNDALSEFFAKPPAILIPVDASKRNPRDRVYPLNMDVPLTELDLHNLHQQTLHALSEAKQNPDSISNFTFLQRQYLASLGGFGTILAKAKEIAVQGESASVGAIKLMAHLPPAIRQLLDKVPTYYERLNNLLKGTEILSNLGAMSTSSSVTRFITAKDDNDQKQLAWGVLTSATGKMTITLRDFRPHVSLLQKARHTALADRVTQDFLDAYANGFNQFIREATQIAVANATSILNR